MHTNLADCYCMVYRCNVDDNILFPKPNWPNSYVFWQALSVISRLSSLLSSVKWNALNAESLSYDGPRAGSGVVRIDPIRILSGCRKRRLNLSSLSIGLLSVISAVYYSATFSVTLVCVYMCYVSWLFWLSCHYSPSDWLTTLRKPVRVNEIIVLFHCLIVCLSCPQPYTI